MFFFVPGNIWKIQKFTLAIFLLHCSRHELGVRVKRVLTGKSEIVSNKGASIARTHLFQPTFPRHIRPFLPGHFVRCRAISWPQFLRGLRLKLKPCPNEQHFSHQTNFDKAFFLLALSLSFSLLTSEIFWDWFWQWSWDWLWGCARKQMTKPGESSRLPAPPNFTLKLPIMHLSHSYKMKMFCAR